MTSSAMSSLSIIPDHWRPEVEECFKNKSLTPTSRDSVTQTLANILFSTCKKPTRADCNDIAKKLILKYPCTKDDIGNGYVSMYMHALIYISVHLVIYVHHSWTEKLMERVRNVIKYDTKKARKSGRDPPSSPKRHKKAANASLSRRYPVSTYELSDVATTERHNKAISDELKKSKPRDALLLPLLKATFGERRMFIMNDATCVADVLERHPALSRTAAVSQSFVYKMSEESMYLLLLIIGINRVKYIKPPLPPPSPRNSCDNSRSYKNVNCVCVCAIERINIY